MKHKSSEKPIELGVTSVIWQSLDIQDFCGQYKQVLDVLLLKTDISILSGQF